MRRWAGLGYLESDDNPDTFLHNTLLTFLEFFDRFAFWEQICATANLLNIKLTNSFPEKNSFNQEFLLS